MKIAAAVMAGAGVLALVQTVNAPKSGKRLALGSIRYALEGRMARDRDGVVREATEARGRLASETEEDAVFRDATAVWLAHEPSRDLRRPTAAEDAGLPLALAAEAVRRLSPATGFEGGRIRALYESRAGKDPHDQTGPLSKVVAANPGDDAAVRAYIAALRGGAPEERRKAVEIARGYAARDGGSPLSRLTLLLALDASIRRGGGGSSRELAEVREIAGGLVKELPPGAVGYDAVRGLATGPVTR